MSNPSLLQPILALLGHPAAHNPSQFMYERAFAYHQLDWRYLSLDVVPEELANAVRGMRAMGFLGATCAEPHKQAAVLYLDRNTAAAELAGSVNCVLRENNQLVGENTEGKAFAAALRQRLDLAGKHVVLLGAGRLARAVAAELAAAQVAEVTVVNRGEARGRQLAELLSGRLHVASAWVPWEGSFGVSPETDVLLHVASRGAGDPNVSLGALRADALVGDATLNPPRTELLRLAQERGCRTIDGLELFVGQAVINFRLWTGIDLEPAVMTDAVEEFLGL